MEPPLLDDGTTVKEDPPVEDWVLVELPDGSGEPFDAVDKRLEEDVV